jgi:hypothetical protein
LHAITGQCARIVDEANDVLDRSNQVRPRRDLAIVKGRGEAARLLDVPFDALALCHEEALSSGWCDVLLPLSEDLEVSGAGPRVADALGAHQAGSQSPSGIEDGRQRTRAVDCGRRFLVLRVWQSVKRKRHIVACNCADFALWVWTGRLNFSFLSLSRGGAPFRRSSLGGGLRLYFLFFCPLLLTKGGVRHKSSERIPADERR